MQVAHRGSVFRPRRRPGIRGRVPRDRAFLGWLTRGVSKTATGSDPDSWRAMADSSWVYPLEVDFAATEAIDRENARPITEGFPPLQPELNASEEPLRRGGVVATLH
jgi:hypothetical protein